jgi:hypothetical protein
MFNQKVINDVQPKSRLSWLSAVVVVIVLSGASVCRAQVSNMANASVDAGWIMTAVIDDGSMNGAIGMYPDSNGLTHIRPYQANLACLGLARASAVTGDPRYVNAAWNYLNWYAGHMDTLGYVHDWDLVHGVWTQGGYDSTDSYAATFLLAVRAAYRVSGDAVKLKNISWGIQVAVNAIYTTQQSDGMTWATPAYHVKYLEDQVEAYRGLNAGYSLATLLGLPDVANKAQSYANSMESGIATLWNSSNNNYNWAKHEDGVEQITNWSTLSPDTMEEGWPVSFKVVTGSRAADLLKDINAFQPDWDKPAKNHYNYDVIPVGWGYYFNGQKTIAHAAAANIRKGAIAANRAWPFTPGDCGSLILLETDGEDLVL